MNESENLLDHIADATQSLAEKTDIGCQDINQFVAALEPLRSVTAEELISDIALTGDRLAAVKKINSIRESMGQLMNNPSFINMLGSTDFDLLVLLKLNQCRDNLLVSLRETINQLMNNPSFINMLGSTDFDPRIFLKPN